jgi:hypothetical protein
MQRFWFLPVAALPWLYSIKEFFYLFFQDWARILLLAQVLYYHQGSIFQELPPRVGYLRPVFRANWNMSLGVT